MAIYKFLLLSDEVDQFRREIAINADSTFEKLQDTILDSVKFNKQELCSFSICDDSWEKQQEVLPFDLANQSDSQFDSYTMADTRLEELLEEEEQKVMFIFDMLTERAFFMELFEIEYGKSLTAPRIIVSEGNPPTQSTDFDDFERLPKVQIDLGEEFYGSEEFDINELDQEGFDIETPDTPTDTDEF